jgi:hypothetical protein
LISGSTFRLIAPRVADPAREVVHAVKIPSRVEESDAVSLLLVSRRSAVRRMVGAGWMSVAPLTIRAL